jgi:hypothetical protein
MSEAPSCNEIQANLPLFVGEDLEQAVLEQVRSHLPSCPDCSARHAAAWQARAALLRLQARSLTRTQAVDMSEDLDLWPQLRERLRAEGLLGDSDLDRRAPVSIRSPLRSEVSLQPQIRRRMSSAAVWRLAGALTAAAALVLLFGPGGDPGGAEPSPVSLSRPSAQVVNQPLPVGLRKAGPLDERLSEQAVPLRFWIQPKQRIPIHVGENVMAGSGVR